MQFIGTVSVWQLSERFGLSGILTTVGFAMTLARLAPARTEARVRVPTNAVWATVVFALNLLAFIFIGLQLRPILIELPQATRYQYLAVAAAVVATVIAVRIVWHMTFNRLLRLLGGRHSLRAARLMLRPTVGSGLVISWTGKRGVVTLQRMRAPSARLARLCWPCETPGTMPFTRSRTSWTGCVPPMQMHCPSGGIGRPNRCQLQKAGSRRDLTLA